MAARQKKKTGAAKSARVCRGRSVPAFGTKRARLRCRRASPCPEGLCLYSRWSVLNFDPFPFHGKSNLTGVQENLVNYYGGKELAESFRTVRKNTLAIAEDIPEDK